MKHLGWCTKAPKSFPRLHAVLTPKAWASVQIQCNYGSRLLYVWKKENCKLGELACKMCDESVNEFDVPTALRTLKISADGPKYKMAQKSEYVQKVVW